MYALDGIDVVALENGVSAPLCTRLLGDLGADVVKIERPGVGDVNRQWDEAVHGRSSAHVWADRNKRSLELDLKATAGRELFMELAERADVVVQNYSPGVVERLGIGFDSVQATNSDVVYVNISGYGRSGPYRDRKAYDLVMQGETGLILMTGSPDAPAKIPLSICDINAGMYAALGTMTALYHREATGEGQEIDVSMFGGMLSWLGVFPHKYWHEDDIPERVGMRHHLITPYGPYLAADDQYISFACLSDAHWRTFCDDVIDRPDLVEDPRFATNEQRITHREALEATIEERLAEEPSEYWAERFQAAGLPWGHVNDIGEVLAHPQTEHLGIVRELDHETGPIKFIDNPLDMSTLSLRRDAMPALGEHNRAVLRELGYDEEAIDRFMADDIV